MMHSGTSSSSSSRPGSSRPCSRCLHGCNTPGTHLATPVRRPVQLCAPVNRVCIKAGASSDNGASTEDVLESLREAFGAAPVRSSVQAQPQQLQQRAKAGQLAAGSRDRGGSRSSSGQHRLARGTRDGSSLSRLAEQQGDLAPAFEDAAAAVAAPPSPKKRRGPFGDLILALEHEQLYPEETGSKSSNGSSGSSPSPSSSSTTTTTTSSSSSAAPASSSTGTSHQQQHQQPTTRSPAGTSASVGRQIRRVRLQPQQQQQQPADSHSKPASHSQHPQRHQQPKHHQQQQQALPPWLLQQQQQQASSKSSKSSSAAAGGPSVHRQQKQYKPVVKGELLLPGGPAWSSLRRHLVAAGSSAELPTLAGSIVIVEGDKDQQAVARAVNVAVYVCDGTRALKDHVRPELQMLTQLGKTLTVLTDPDERGRELRQHLDDIIGPLHHAFVPEQLSTSSVDTATHAAGNRGIEHVVPLGVQEALAAAKPSFGTERRVWSVERLQQMQLANAFDAGHEGVVRGPGGAAARRRLLCALLGLGRCSAGQLVAVLNRFFSEGEVEVALARVDEELPAVYAGADAAGASEELQS